MRTTLTIDDDIAASLKTLARGTGRSFKAVVNDVLRHGLLTGEKPISEREPFRVESAARGFLPGIDPLELNRLLDETEVDRFTEQPHGHTA